MSLFAVYDGTDVIAMASDEAAAQRIGKALALWAALEEKFPGLVGYGEEPVNGADLVDAVTEHMHAVSNLPGDNDGGAPGSGGVQG